MVNIYLDCEDPPAVTKNSTCDKIVEWENAGISHSAVMTGGDGNSCTGGYVRGSQKHHRFGSRCIELIITNISQARKAELKLYGFGTIIDFWGMFWVLFENGFDFLGTEMDCHICQPVYEPTPDYHLSIRIYKVGGVPYLVVRGHDMLTGEYYIVGSSNIPFPIGEWVQIIFYVKRATSNGIVKVWQNHQLVVNNTSVKTSHDTSEGFQLMHQCYMGTNESYPKASYRDDIYINDVIVYDPGWDDINKSIVRGNIPPMNTPEINCPFPM